MHKINNNDCQTLQVLQFTKQMHQVIQFSGYKEYNSLMQFHIQPGGLTMKIQFILMDILIRAASKGELTIQPLRFLTSAIY